MCQSANDNNVNFIKSKLLSKSLDDFLDEQKHKGRTEFYVGVGSWVDTMRIANIVFYCKEGDSKITTIEWWEEEHHTGRVISKSISTRTFKRKNLTAFLERYKIDRYDHGSIFEN